MVRSHLLVRGCYAAPPLETAGESPGSKSDRGISNCHGVSCGAGRWCDYAGPVRVWSHQFLAALVCMDAWGNRIADVRARPRRTAFSGRLAGSAVWGCYLRLFPAARWQCTPGQMDWPCCTYRLRRGAGIGGEPRGPGKGLRGKLKSELCTD